MSSCDSLDKYIKIWVRSNCTDHIICCDQDYVGTMCAKSKNKIII